MPGRPSLDTRPPTSSELPRRRDRQVAWLYIGIAYLLGALIVIAAARMLDNSAPNEEDLSLLSFGLGLVAIVAGLPALVLLWKAVSRSGRADRKHGTSTQHRYLILAVLLFGAATLGGAFAAQSRLNHMRSQVMDHASAGMFDRSGVVVISRGGHHYRNLNDRCSGNGNAPTVPGGCGAENRAPCRSKEWLVNHDAWPLRQIGEVGYIAPGTWGPGSPGFGSRGTISPILRPASQDLPSFLFIFKGSCYLEYRRVT